MPDLARMFEAERGEVDPVDGLVDVAADAGGEEVLFAPVPERGTGCSVAREVCVEGLVTSNATARL